MVVRIGFELPPLKNTPFDILVFQPGNRAHPVRFGGFKPAQKALSTALSLNMGQECQDWIGPKIAQIYSSFLQYKATCFA